MGQYYVLIVSKKKKRWFTTTYVHSKRQWYAFSIYPLIY